MTAPASTDAYLAALSAPARAVLEELRATIRAAAPAAEETIAYDMPAFRLGRHFLVSYAAWKHHFSLFPASQAVLAALGEEVAPFFSGRGTLRFTLARPLPAALVRRIVAVRLEEVSARGL